MSEPVFEEEGSVSEECEGGELSLEELAHRITSGTSTAQRCAAVVQLASAVAGADRRAGDPPRREVVVHADAAVIADDAAAGRA